MYSSANAVFGSVVVDVLNRADAHACVPEETLRRIAAAMHDNNIGIVYGVTMPRENSDEDTEWIKIQAIQP